MLAAALTAHAAPGDPGKVAIGFLEKVRQRKLNLEPGGDTAISAQTADGKRHQIAKLIERMARELGSDPIEVGEVRLDENFAAVLVRKVGGFDPGRLQIFPVALVKRGAEWTAAPVPASFENAGANHAISLRKRVKLLENWMLREQVVDLEKLRQQSADRMRQQIEVSLSAKELRGFTARQMGERFLQACEKKDQPAILGLLGGLSPKLPDDWAARLKSVDRALATGSTDKHPWRLLVSPEVVRVLVHEEERNDGGRVTIGCLDPAGDGGEGAAPRLEAVACELAKGKDGLWQINLPTPFLQENNEPAEDADDSPHLAAFSARWTEAHPPTPQAGPDQARQTLLKALGGGDLKSLLMLVQLDADESDARQAILQAAGIWQFTHDPASVRHVMPLAFQSGESSAVATFQFFSTRQPDRLDTRTFYFEKSPAGWLWTPIAAERTRAQFQPGLDAAAAQWPGEWQQTLLGDSPVLGELKGLQAPGSEDARKAVQAWLDATRLGDVTASLPLTARLNTPRSAATVLQNLGYELLAGRRSKVLPVITGIYQGEIWTAVGVKMDQGGKSTYPLYPLVQTASGPRVVIEIDLFASGNRGRDYLNKMAFERLEKGSSVAIADELRGLYAKHQADLEGLIPGPPR